jgi:hypothetical protein
MNRNAAEVCRNAELSEEAQKLLKPTHTVKQFLDELQAKKQVEQAIKVLAHALPKRAAVWWLCQCAKKTMPATAKPEVKAALAAAEKWVSDPSDENRRAAFPAAEKADLGTPAGCAALGAFLSGGSLAPPNVTEVVPPAEHLTAKTVAGGLTLAAVMTEPAKAPERYAQFLALGLEVDAGKNRWPENVSQPKR